MRLRGELKTAVLQQAANSFGKVSKPFGRFRIGVFLETGILVTLGGSVNVEGIERLIRKLVRVLMALPVVTAEPEDLIGAGRAVG